MTQFSSTSSYLEPDDNTIKQWFAQLQEFKNNGTFCDITLKAGSKEIQAHRVILAASIPFFSCMLQNNYKENRKKNIEVKEIDPIALDNLINLSYGVELEINQQNAAKLIVGADYLRLVHVKTACGDFLRSHLTPENVLETKEVAEKLYCSDVVSAAEEFIDNNFSDFAKTDEFLEMEKHELIEIIKRDQLRAKEEVVYQAVMKWIKYEGPERIALLPEVLSHVRMSLLSPLYLVRIVQKESLIKTSPECRDLLEEATTYHLMKGIETSVAANIRNRPRRKFDKVHILGGSNSNGLVSSLQIYDIREDKWISKYCALATRFSGSAVFQENLYIFGGNSTDNECLSGVKIFNFKTEQIKQGRNMSSPIELTAAAALGDEIYVSGGSGGNDALNFHQRYSPKLDAWTELAPLNQKRSSHGVVALNGRIYAIGGWDNSPLNSCERYDPLKNTWSLIKPMTSVRDSPGVAVLNGKIFVCGGWNGNEALNSSEVYDPVEDKWTQAAPMNTRRCAHALVSDGTTKLYAIGGKEDGTTFSSSCEVYDLETDSWGFVEPLITPTTFASTT